MLFQNTSYKPYGYNSTFQDWHDHASIRVKPRRVISVDDIEGKVFFPPELFPVVSHPLIQERGEAFIQKLLVHRLYTYLDFTGNLEHEIVNQVVYQIASGQLGIELSQEMKIDAYKIYVDEAYHTMFCADIKAQVEEATGVAPISVGTSRFLQRFRYIQESADSELREMIKVFLTIVSETLISAILTEVPKNKHVVNPVREIILDHAQDESRHHAYFASLLEVLWSQLKPKYHSIIGPLLPEFIFAFLEPDIGAIKGCLLAVGLKPQEIDIIVEESYPREQVILSIKQAAKVTLKHFQRSGVFEEPYTVEVFEESGLFNAIRLLIV